MSGYKLNQSISNYDITTNKLTENLSRISDNAELGLRSSGDNFHIAQVVSGFGLAPVGADSQVSNQPTLVDLGDGISRFKVKIKIVSDLFFPGPNVSSFTNLFSDPLNYMENPSTMEWKSTFHPVAYTSNNKVQIPYFGSYVSIRESAGIYFIERIINTSKVLLGGTGVPPLSSDLDFSSLGKFPAANISWDIAMKVMPKNCKKMECIDPLFRPLLENIMAQLRAKGYDPIIGSGYRNVTSQIQKIKEGKSKAKNPFGYHVCLNENGQPSSMAVDLVHKPVGWGGKTQETKLKAYEFFDDLGKIVLATGKITWGGSWTPKKRTIGGKEFFIGWDPAHINVKVPKKQLINRTIAGIKKLAGRA